MGGERVKLTKDKVMVPYLLEVITQLNWKYHESVCEANSISAAITPIAKVL